MKYKKNPAAEEEEEERSVFFFSFLHSAVCLRSTQLFGVFLFEIEFSETRGCTRWFSSSFHSFPV
jgi:hypothetical protein